MESLGLPSPSNPRGKDIPDANTTAVGLPWDSWHSKRITPEHKKEGLIIQAMPICKCWKDLYIRDFECFGPDKIEIPKTLVSAI